MSSNFSISFFMAILTCLLVQQANSSLFQRSVSVSICRFKTGDTLRDEQLSPFYVPTNDRELYEAGVKAIKSNNENSVSSKSGDLNQLSIKCEDSSSSNTVKCGLCLYSELSESRKQLQTGQILDISIRECMLGSFRTNSYMDYHPICYPIGNVDKNKLSKTSDSKQTKPSSKNNNLEVNSNSENVDNVKQSLKELLIKMVNEENEDTTQKQTTEQAQNARKVEKKEDDERNQDVTNSLLNILSNSGAKSEVQKVEATEQNHDALDNLLMNLLNLQNTKKSSDTSGDEKSSVTLVDSQSDSNVNSGSSVFRGISGGEAEAQKDTNKVSSENDELLVALSKLLVASKNKAPMQLV